MSYPNKVLDMLAQATPHYQVVEPTLGWAAMQGHYYSYSHAASATVFQATLNNGITPLLDQYAYLLSRHQIVNYAGGAKLKPVTWSTCDNVSFAADAFGIATIEVSVMAALGIIVMSAGVGLALGVVAAAGVIGNRMACDTAGGGGHIQPKQTGQTI